ncbi:hypothetical protein BH23ACT10_BH23ACT10_12710 [soil metagenome]
MIVYDTGALVASERNDRQLWALYDAALRRGITPIVPAGVLAQAWRGGPQARLSQLLRGCTVTPLGEPLARDVGALCAAAGTSDIVDASVIVIAQSRRAAVVTSDEPDIRHLASSIDAALPIHAI